MRRVAAAYMARSYARAHLSVSRQGGKVPAPEEPPEEDEELLDADWNGRIAGVGVVWYHDFESVNEVNAFRWTPAYNNGNDPLAVGSDEADLVTRIDTDGIRGHCLQITRPTGTEDGSHWWRPMSPMSGGTTTGNGRGAGQDDPAANGELDVESYTATDGGNQIAGWGSRGYYGTAGTGPFDGADYWLQARVKIDPRRIQGDNASIDVGKLFYFTITDFSASQQEIVVYSGAPVSGENYLRMYRSVSPALDTDSPGVAVHGNQPGTEYGTVGDGVCRLDNNGGRLANCWHWPEDEWATVMWHIRPGTHSGNDTLVEVYAALPGESVFTRIWNQPNVDLVFSGFPTNPDPQGHNALICSVYHNGTDMDEFWHRYCQIIHSWDFIPCPQIYGDEGPDLALACYGLSEGASATFALGEQSAFVENDLAWQTVFHHDEITGYCHLMGKPANADSSWSHQRFRIATNTWAIVDEDMWSNPGHIYGNFGIDYTTGDLYQARGGMDNSGNDQYKKIAKWTRGEGAAGTWGYVPTGSDIYASGLVSHCNGLAYHPHLYGRNDGGLVIDQQFRHLFWRQSDDSIEDIGHSNALYGDKEGAAVFWPAQNCVLVGGSISSPQHGHLSRVDANNGDTPIVTDLGIPPIPVGGHSHEESTQFGSLHVHPGDPNVVVILETNGTRWWSSTDGDNWTLEGTAHPFTFEPRVVCPLRNGYKCFWAVGVSDSVVWKPPT